MKPQRQLHNRCCLVRHGSKQQRRSNSTMKGVLLKDYGSAEKSLEVHHSIKIPSPSSSEVLVKVKNTSINALDVRMREGYGKEFFQSIKRGREDSVELGRDFSGTIVSIGSNVLQYKVGDEVFGASDPILLNGSYAEYVTSQEHHLLHKPKNLSFRESAALPFVGTTAYRALVKDCKVKGGESVLILGASSAVGKFSIQLLRHLNCRVTAVCANQRLNALSVYSPDVSMDYDALLSSDDSTYDVILDASGRRPSRDILSKVKRGGHYASLNGDLIRSMDAQGIACGSLSATLQLFGEKLIQRTLGDSSFHWTLFRPTPAALQLIVQLIESNSYISIVDQKHFQLDDIVAAHQYYESGKANGKIVIDI